MYPGNKRKKLWREEKERLLKMTLEERRKEYLGDYVALKTIPTWMEDLKSKSESDGENAKEDLQGKKSLSEKVSLYRGDITLLEVDAIVNAANSSLLGGGGVDGCIHRAAGPCLVAECRNLSGCETGQAKITCGYDLPAKYVIHTVGPIARGHLTDTHKENLASCYKSSLKLAKENNIRSIAFPCISTGIYGFPNEPAAIIALNTIKEWLSKNHNEVDRIIFCVFLEVDYKIFKKKMGEFFPLDDANEEGAQLSEEREGQPPSPTKSKEEQPEDLQDDAEGEGYQVPAPSPLLLRAALCRASLGNNSPLVPSAGCQEELPAGKRDSIIPQPLNISWVQCATRCTSVCGKHLLCLFSFHPPNHIWTTAIPFTRFHVLSQSKVADARNFSCVALEKL
ncbi:ADP-ribose glycohydrolase MACROD2 isoform X5 [Aphelocoma coerulescens]|uniref:ADP-ribose glycohydrolase MACROD2 isoform X5 n=1 Tax=Aphelocoma coerulescens TaxID=39617 RepID=UPI003604F5F1